MSNLLTYMNWRGDLPLTLIPLNEVDGLILAQLSMMRWENVLKPDESGTIRALAPRMTAQPVSVGFTAPDDFKLIGGIAECARYSAIVATDYVHTFNPEIALQFAAITLLLPDGTVFVAFRGTDSSIAGWKEDFNMAYAKPVPAQWEALNYLRSAAAKHPGPIRVAGHSKGGNLAMYAASMVEGAVLERVAQVYSYDGPGLSDQINAQGLYERLGDRLKAYVPQSSVIGMLLAHPDDVVVVKSDSVSVMQHNPYSWQVEGPRFVRCDGLSKDSQRFEAAFRKWLTQVDEADRALLVESLFRIIDASKARKFGKGFWQGLLRNPGAVFDAMTDINPEGYKRISQMLGDLALDMLRAGDASEEQ